MDLNDIPYGDYCFKIKEIEGGCGRLKMELCPYYQYLDNGQVSCLYLGIQEEDILLVDKVKICGVNEYDDCENYDICYICSNPIKSWFDNQESICEECFRIGLGKTKRGKNGST
jgi:hypothetical protein